MMASMKLLLAQAPFRDTFGYSMPPPGLLRLGGELARQGIAVELEDLALRLARGELANGSLMCESAARLLLRRGDHEVIGLSVMGATLPAALEITRRLRDLRPGVKLLLGGPGTTGCDRAILERFPWVDAVVRGEGERTLPELLDHLGQGDPLRGVAGVTWRDHKGMVHVEADRGMITDLGELAPYAWDLLEPLAEYKRVTGELEGLTPIDSGRGCAYDCSFCTIGRYWSRRSRCLPPANLVEEVHALDDIEGARNAYLCHDIFGADRSHAMEFCQRLINRGIRPWECRARVDHLDSELIELMGRAGCYRVLLGVESGAHVVREGASKNQPEDLDVLGVVELCGRAGIRPILSLILGLPGEAQEQLEESLVLVSRAALITDVVISLHLPNPQPGCGLNETHGQGARPLDGIAPDMAFGSGETQPERALIESHPDLFSSWALLADDPAHLRHLAALTKRIPFVLQHFPRSWELLRRAYSCTHLQLNAAWESSELEFAEFARLSPDPLVADALTWEETVRSLDGALPRFTSETPDDELIPAGRVASLASLVSLQFDMPAITAQLARGEEELTPTPCSTHLAITPFPGGVRSHRVSPDIVSLLELVETPRRLDELESEHAGIGAAYSKLAQAGLVRMSSNAVSN
jgi:hypothetical protein